MGHDEEDVEIYEPAEHPETFDGKVVQDQGDDFEDDDA